MHFHAMLTLVLLPGMDGTGDLFAPFVAALGQSFRVQVVRYPTSDSLGYAELEAFVHASLPVNEPFMLLGESFSGPIATSIAASRPSGLLGLVLCATFVRNPRPLLGAFRSLAGISPVKLAPMAVLGAVLMGSFSTPPLRAALAEAMSKVSGDALRARLRAVMSVDFSARLASVHVPVLYLLATRDRVVPVSASRHIKQVLPSTKVVPIEAPHFLLQASPAQAARVVQRFARQLSVAT